MNLNIRLLNDTAEMPFKHFFCTSKYLIKKIKESSINFRKKKIILLPNSIDLNNYSTVKNKSNKNIIFCCSRLSDEKGIEFLIETFQNVINIKSDVELLLCGGDFHFGNKTIMQTFIKSKCNNNPKLRKKIKILPLLKWNEIPKYLNLAKIVVIPSKDETFGNSALEAMALGKLIIYSKRGNLPYLIKDSGIPIDYGNIDSFSAAIINTLSGKIKLKEISDKAINYSKHYDNNLISKKFIYYISKHTK